MAIYLEDGQVRGHVDDCSKVEIAEIHMCLPHGVGRDMADVRRVCRADRLSVKEGEGYMT